MCQSFSALLLELGASSNYKRGWKRVYCKTERGREYWRLAWGIACHTKQTSKLVCRLTVACLFALIFCMLFFYSSFSNSLCFSHTNRFAFPKICVSLPFPLLQCFLSLRYPCHTIFVVIDTNVSEVAFQVWSKASLPCKPFVGQCSSHLGILCLLPFSLLTSYLHLFYLIIDSEGTNDILLYLTCSILPIESNVSLKSGP